MTTSVRYKIRNWSDYNQSLINRGNLTIWFDDGVIQAWNTVEPNGRRGRDKTFSDLAIECVLTLRRLFRLPLRQTQGLIDGLFTLLKVPLASPYYTTLSRRADGLGVDLQALPQSRPLHLVVDGTGLKIYGEGEWKMRTHGKDKRRTWRKLHLGINRETHEIVAITLTESNVHDSMQTAALLSQTAKVATVTGDKGYDNRNAYGPIAAAGARAIIPPRSGAALKTKDITWADVERNRLLHENHLLGKAEWKAASGYSRRSLVETAIGRYKSMLGAGLRSRKMATQVTEARLGAKILNRMTHLGMPESYKA
jgi:Transposase DDE domain